MITDGGLGLELVMVRDTVQLVKEDVGGGVLQTRRTRAGGWGRGWGVGRGSEIEDIMGGPAGSWYRHPNCQGPEASRNWGAWATREKFCFWGRSTALVQVTQGSGGNPRGCEFAGGPDVEVGSVPATLPALGPGPEPPRCQWTGLRGWAEARRRGPWAPSLCWQAGASLAP